MALDGRQRQMIDQDTLTYLKDLWLKASKPPMVLAPLGTSRQLVQISTLKPGALEVAKFVTDPAEPEKVPVCSAMDNAKFIMAIWANAPALFEAAEKVLEWSEGFPKMETVVASARDSATDPVVGVPGDGEKPR